MCSIVICGPPSLEESEEVVMEDLNSPYQWEGERASKMKKLVKDFVTVYQDLDDDVDMSTRLLAILDDMKELKAIPNSVHIAIMDRLDTHFTKNLEAAIKSTIEYKTRADKEQVLHLLTAIEDERAERWKNEVKKYLDGEIPLESVGEIAARKIDDKIRAAKVQVVLEQINTMRDKVDKVLRRLVNAMDGEEVLIALRKENMIDEVQYKKLQITPRSIKAISNVVRGKGLYLSKRDHHRGAGILDDIYFCH